MRPRKHPLYLSCLAAFVAVEQWCHVLSFIPERPMTCHAFQLELTASPNHGGLQEENLSPDAFLVHVSYDEERQSSITTATTSRQQRRGTDILVRKGETILSALERASSGASSQSNSGGNTLPPPFDCRRGNCLTCSARHDVDSQVANLEPTSEENGLSPHVAETIEQQGYVLTCSNTVTGQGVSLILGQNNDIWDFVYRRRLETESTETTARAAMAKAIRKSAERNVEEWAEQTEKAYRESETTK